MIKVGRFTTNRDRACRDLFGPRVVLAVPPIPRGRYHKHRQRTPIQVCGGCTLRGTHILSRGITCSTRGLVRPDDHAFGPRRLRGEIRMTPESKDRRDAIPGEASPRCSVPGTRAGFAAGGLDQGSRGGRGTPGERFAPSVRRTRSPSGSDRRLDDLRALGATDLVEPT